MASPGLKCTMFAYLIYRSISMEESLYSGSLQCLVYSVNLVFGWVKKSRKVLFSPGYITASSKGFQKECKMSFKSRRCVRSRSLSILSGPARMRDAFMMAIHLGLSFTPPHKSLCHSPSKMNCRGDPHDFVSKQKHKAICVIHIISGCVSIIRNVPQIPISTVFLFQLAISR